MPLTKCPACEKEVLLDKVSCQDCGGAIKDISEEASVGINPDDPAHIFGLMTFGVVILGVIYLLVKSCSG